MYLVIAFLAALALGYLELYIKEKHNAHNIPQS